MLWSKTGDANSEHVATYPVGLETILWNSWELDSDLDFLDRRFGAQAF